MVFYRGAKRAFITYGKHASPSRMTAEERITKARLGNPELWRQLVAISSGNHVNHLGRKHSPRRDREFYPPSEGK